jgi:hypothetical protein
VIVEPPATLRLAAGAEILDEATVRKTAAAG